MDTRFGNVREALETAGYHPGSDETAHDMGNEILRRIDTRMEYREALTAAELGISEWIRVFFQVSHHENPK